MTDPQSPAARWWLYQRERFPLAAHGPLIAAFSFCAVSYSHLLRTGVAAVPPLSALATAFATCLLFFLQLRIADEFKDFEEDSTFRPYRPVPRGLVTLKSLGVVFALAAAVQLALALWLQPRMALLLLVPWVYLAAMSREFGARAWLKQRPVVYLWTHMLIMPLVDLYATGCDWLAMGQAAPKGLFWFLLASFFNGIVIEIGRKLRSPQDEETGVETYTRLWGTRGGPGIWLAALAATAGCALMAAHLTGHAAALALLLGAVLAPSAIFAARFVRQPSRIRGKGFEALAGIWTLALYLGLGVLPLILEAAKNPAPLANSSNLLTP